MNTKKLIELLAQEQKVHEQLLKAKRDERKLLSTAAANQLLKNTEKISDLIEQAHRLEKQRKEFLHQAALEWGLDPATITINDIVPFLPPAYRLELEIARNSLKTTLKTIREVNRTNHVILQRSIETIGDHLKQFVSTKESGVYNAKGTKDYQAIPRSGFNLRA